MGLRIRTANRAIRTTATVGTATYDLGAAVTGYLGGASDIASGDTTTYLVCDSLTAPTLFEVGRGVFTTGSPDRITRAQVVRNSSGTTSAISWASGSKFVVLGLDVAEFMLSLDTDGWIHLAGDLVLATAGTERLRISASGAWTVADPLLARAGLGAAPIPTRFGTSVGGAAVLPAGGTWEWWLFRVNNATGAVTSASNSAGPTPGGTTIGAATAGEVWSGMAWRVT